MEAWIQPVAALVLAVVIPFAVNLCTTATLSGSAKRWTALGVSLLAGAATGFVVGCPTPETLVTFSLSVVGGVQAAYTMFKSVGVTNNVLEALQNVGKGE